jgi:hypothetical protein
VALDVHPNVQNARDSKPAGRGIDVQDQVMRPNASKAKRALGEAEPIGRAGAAALAASRRSAR